MRKQRSSQQQSFVFGNKKVKAVEIVVFALVWAVCSLAISEDLVLDA